MKNIGLKDFLKTYTAISNNFIDKYYNFYEKCENNIFGINVRDVINYLKNNDSKKFYMKIRINYKINIDYIIIRKLKTGSKSAKRVDYFITLDCFEKLCMTSRTSKG